MSDHADNISSKQITSRVSHYRRGLLIVLSVLALIRLGILITSRQAPLPSPMPAARLPEISYQQKQDETAVRLKQSLEILGVLLSQENEANGTGIFYTNKYATMDTEVLRFRLKKLRPLARGGNLTAQRELARALLYMEIGTGNMDEADHWARQAAVQLTPSLVKEENFKRALETSRKHLLNRGQTLAKQICTSCHQYPDPSVHNRADWIFNVLPWMEFMLAIRERVYETPFGGKIEIETGHFPPKPLLSLTDWTAIQYFYVSKAPSKLTTLPKRDRIKPSTRRFEVITTKTPLEPSVCLVKIDSKNKCFYASDFGTKKLYRMNAEGKVLDTLDIKDTATSLTTSESGPLVVLAGNVYNSDALKGKLLRLNKPQLDNVRTTTLLTKLRRPSELAAADLNNDGLEDLVICEFGLYAGRVCWWEQKKDGGYSPHVLLNKPGGINVRIRDFNKDGLPDIALIIAQSQEGIHLFLNKGNGQFEQMDIRRRHPAWGYSHMEAVDFDQDGDLDLLVTNGDNGDIKAAPMRPYHGVRLLLNDGQNNFEEKFFWPQNGAFGALPEDFDGDGDIDIIAISYFPNYANTPSECLVYLENQGDLKFAASTFSNNTSGRWLVLDKGDIDGDGDIDVVLGAFNEFQGQRPQKIQKIWENEGTSIMILKNTTN